MFTLTLNHVAPRSCLPTAHGLRNSTASIIVRPHRQCLFGDLLTTGGNKDGPYPAAELAVDRESLPMCPRCRIMTILFTTTRPAAASLKAGSLATGLGRRPCRARPTRSLSRRTGALKASEARRHRNPSARQLDSSKLAYSDERTGSNPVTR
jgi:hypothetical protein